MWVHRRLAALALFGVQLLQGTLPAVGGACVDAPSASGRDVVATAPAPTGVMPTATAHHGHHAAATATSAPTAAPTGSSAPTDTPAHPHESTTCPMAMACAVAGLMSTAVAVELHDVLMVTDRSETVADRLVSVDVTPEPPPPRR
jgi:hypothetical protein